MSQTHPVDAVMSQSKRGSMCESVLGTATGFLVSMCIWQTIGPWFGYDVTLGDNLVITSIFTVASLARGYLLRRAFNWHQHHRRNPTR